MQSMQSMRPDEMSAAIQAAALKGEILVLVMPGEVIVNGLKQWALDMGTSPDATAKAIVAPKKDVYSICEREFARLLSPMEIETINGWSDDGHSEELIKAALKEAVFANKLNIRYIDRILLDWQRNKIVTTDQAKEHAQKFRGRKD